MRKIFICFIFVVSLFMCGCGDWSSSKGDVSIKSRIPVKADNPQVQQFNTDLGAISDEASATTAVNSFFAYVDSRINNDFSVMSIQSSSSLIRSDLLQKLVEGELSSRSIGKMSISSVSTDQGGYVPIDIGAITDAINVLGEPDGVKVDDEIVTIVKTVVEESIPNLNPDGSKTMTPLEALVISYSLMSGDDGSAVESSIDLPSDKVEDFIDIITR